MSKVPAFNLIQSLDGFLDRAIYPVDSHGNRDAIRQFVLGNLPQLACWLTNLPCVPIGQIRPMTETPRSLLLSAAATARDAAGDGSLDEVECKLLEVRIDGEWRSFVELQNIPEVPS